jgi:hypothetical protein
MADESPFRQLQGLRFAADAENDPSRRDGEGSARSRTLTEALARVADPEVREHLERLLKDLGHLD